MNIRPINELTFDMVLAAFATSKKLHPINKDFIVSIGALTWKQSEYGSLAAMVHHVINDCKDSKYEEVLVVLDPEKELGR